MQRGRSDSRRGGILIVDDTPANLHLLAGLLREKGYLVRPVPDGTLALRAAETSPPDLILLDISMPGMDGFEVCRELKVRPNLARIPVLFISALDETLDKVKAFSCGGVDYVTKPFQAEEVLARVATHLRIGALQLEIERHNRHLEDVVRQRTRELFEAHARLSILDDAKSDFLRLISHELRTPLNGLLGSVEVLLEYFEASPARETPSGRAESADHEPGTEKMKALFERSRKRLLTILDDALLLTQIETSGPGFTLAEVRVTRAIDAAIRAATELAAHRHVVLTTHPSDATGLADEELLGRALGSLLTTAVKLSASPGTVEVTATREEGDVVISLQARGRTIPERALPRFFDVLAIAEPITPGGDLGLGPAVAHRLVALFGGSTTIANLEPPGVVLTVKLRGGTPAASRFS